jgi:hypothetical protein
MSKKTFPVYKEALGIAVGDIVHTSYNTGPYTVLSIWGPHQYRENWQQVTIWPWPVISLALADADGRTGYYINEIHLDGDRWFSGRDEIFVTKPETRPPAQLSLFPDPSPTASPYPFQDGVDYEAGDGRLWRCEECGGDYDTDQPHQLSRRPECPYCGATWKAIPIINMGVACSRQLDSEGEA